MIKFRAWDKTKKIMHEVATIDFVANQVLTQTRNTMGRRMCRSFDDIVLMQSTGLFDKNGQEIFEGDVVEYEGKERAVVAFERGVFKMRLNIFFSAPLCNAKKANIEVIGNIYENPDLMEAENE